ncbi:MAG: transcriptional regulator [Deltaproteobacteria bacterium]|nr:transcriptional regulator [Deltaproteobacteria bacterium]MBW2208010.1 transcriptional regulator [Deltaproteobacteria bacterium]
MPPIDKVIHERARLLIMTYLASQGKSAVSFNELLEKLDFTPGNLSIQLKRLKSAKYVKIKKSFRDNKPHTTVSLTATGGNALTGYVNEMEAIIKTLKKD